MTIEAEGRQARRFEWLDLLRLGCASAVLLFHYGFVAPIPDRALPPSYAMMPGVNAGYDMVAGCAIVLAGTLLVAASAFERNPLRVGRLAVLGAMTYPLYLLHAEIGVSLMRLFVPLLNPAVVIVVTIALMFASAFAVSRYAEPMIRARLKSFRTTLSSLHSHRDAGKVS